jgi:hypothetical protein
LNKILILTDSLGLPRSEPEICEYHESWPYKLSISDNIVQQVSLGGATLIDLIRQIEYHKGFNPDFVFLQCGIVDCAPRALYKFEIHLLKMIGKPGRLILNLLYSKRNFLRKYRNIKRTKESDFKKGIIHLKKIYGRKLYTLSIINPSDNYENKVPGIKKNVSIYNRILKDTNGEGYLDLNRIPHDFIMTDFIHLNNKGHDFIFKKITDLLTEH